MDNPVYTMDVHKAFLVETEARPRPRPSEPETETRPRRNNSEARPNRGTTASRRPRDRGVKTDATSHIHIILKTDVVPIKKKWGPRTEAEPKWHIQA